MITSRFELYAIKNKGFTLLEAMMVIVIVGILGSVLGPRFIGDNGFEAYAYRAETISTLRAIQQRAMQNPQTRQCVLITEKKLGQPNTCPVEGLLTFSDTWSGDDTTSVIMTHDTVYYTQTQYFAFDSLGRPVCQTSPCPIDIIIEGSPPLKLRIESEGYIHVK